MITQVPRVQKQADAIRTLLAPNPYRRVAWPNLYRGPALPGEGEPTIEPPEKVDVDLIFDSIKAIVLTNQGERLLEPEFGSRVRELVGEPLSRVFEMKVYDMLTVAVKSFEPRARIQGVQVSYVENSAHVTYALVINQLGVNAQDTFKVPLG